MAEQQGRKERDLPHQASRGAAAAVAKRAVSPRAEEMQRQVCGGWAWQAGVPAGWSALGRWSTPRCLEGLSICWGTWRCFRRWRANGFPLLINIARAFRCANRFSCIEQSFEYSLSKQLVQKIILIALLLMGLQNLSQIEKACLSAIEAFWARHIPCIREDLYSFDQTSLLSIYTHLNISFAVLRLF